MVRFSLILIFLAAPGLAVTVRSGALGGSVNEQTCAVPKPSDAFAPGDRQAFFAFIAQGIRAGDRLRVEWVEPNGAVFQISPYEDLPSAPSFCLITQLPIAGFEAANRPGAWSVRVIVDEKILFTKGFNLAADAYTGGPRIQKITRRTLDQKQMEVTIDGAGFDRNSVVHLAEYSNEDGWKYLAASFPEHYTPTQIVLHYPDKPPGEYMLIIRNGDDRLSQPGRLLIESESGYKLPTPAGEPWVVTQGPYGSFSHWGNALQAWDIAPPARGRCIVAMRAGTAYVFDRGMKQNHATRSFGNYVTIQHDNGEFSHYAHLETGTFQVKNGQHVEQGQALAVVGNSGYTLGEGGGYHVHVHVTKAFPIASQSIPFHFEDLPKNAKAGFRGTVLSANNNPELCQCKLRNTVAGGVGGGPIVTGKQFQASVPVADWWNEFLTVAPKTPSLDIKLSWTGAEADADLHLMSPSGKHYGWYGITDGYSGQKSNPEEFHIKDPEPGMWRVAVQGMQSRGSAPIEFKIETSVTDPPPPPAPAKKARR